MSADAHQTPTIQNDHGVLIEATQGELGAIERFARTVVQQLAIKNEDNLSGPNDVHVRDLLPGEDLTSGSANGWTTSTEEWTQSGLTADSWNETYIINATNSGTNNAESKYIALFAVGNNSPSPATTGVRFTSSTGALFEKLSTEGIFTDEETLGLIADGVVVLNGQHINIDQYVTATSDEFMFHGAVAEPAGNTIEEGVDRFLQPQAQKAGVPMPGQGRGAAGQGRGR